MNNFIVQYGSEIALMIRVISSIILAIFMIPLQWKQVNVKNGLRNLRIQLLIFGIILLLTNCMTSYFLVDLILNDIPQKSLNVILQIINASTFLAISIIGYQIYHQQYTPKSKRFHEKVEKMEKKEASQIDNQSSK